jgi:hypothetical protein
VSGHSITRSDVKIIQSLLLALEPLANLRGPVPLRLVTTFLTVATNEGHGVCEYARLVGMHRAVMTRYIHGLADHTRTGGPGLGLLRIDEGSYPNRQEIYLTKKGHTVAMAMLRSLRRLHSNGPLRIGRGASHHYSHPHTWRRSLSTAPSAEPGPRSLASTA